MSIDPQIKRIFFAVVNNIIAVLNGDATTTPILEIDARHVITNSEVTKSVQEVVAFEKYIVWTSSAWNKLYVGRLKDNMMFISRNDVLEESRSECSGICLTILFLFKVAMKKSCYGGEWKEVFVEEYSDDKMWRNFHFFPHFIKETFSIHVNRSNTF